ncbi:hypothetical protein [Mycobacterium parmense]|uniref:Uncharacterized protein n=1 Tax=Mycobacterium parmense TaxID=185642 RepID=A0A7I7YZL6_9MYCO|nr:hypothetical protein [Mycobacterium parmense]MCV7352749.1 hypothetical protein [Mycobacterium parmense]ORW54659.1 hypothetical protein AWC20_19390 [Mycobacterium parmense]BBZ46757.1 hypothetical protein MPRM_40380 [Mycobacterium parmense]
MPQHPFDSDDDDLAAALDFSGSTAPVSDEDDGEYSAGADDWRADVPAESGELSTDLAAVSAPAEAIEGEDEQDAESLFTVPNPAGTVAVSAVVDGGIHQVTLSGRVTNMTESQLAEEIMVLAHLARQKGQAAQHEFLLESMRELGADDTAAIRDVLENGMELPSPQQASETQARVFATRYQAQ